MLQSNNKDNEKLKVYYTGYKKLWEEINAKKQKEAKLQEANQDKTVVEAEPKDELMEKEVVSSDSPGIEILDDKIVNNVSTIEPPPPEPQEPKALKKKTKKRQNNDTNDAKKKKKPKLQDDEDFTNFDVDALVDKAEEKLRLKAQKQLRLMKKEELRQQKQAAKDKKKQKKNKKTKKQKEGDADEIREIEVDSGEQLLENASGVEENNSISTTTSLVPVQSETNVSDSKTPVLLNPKNFLKIDKSKNGKKFDGSQVEIDWGDEDELAAEEEDAQESQRKLIAEAFEDDDVVEDFKRMKDSEIESSKPKDIDLHLPGWGDWGGKGIKVNPKKRQRFIIKAPKQPPRKDSKLSHVILNQEAGEKIRDHQVLLIF